MKFEKINPKKIIIDFIDKIYAIILHYLKIYLIFEGFNDRSYCNNSKNKKFTTKLIDYLYIFIVLKYKPLNYRLYGFDILKREKFKKYIGDRDEPIVAEKLKALSSGNGVLLDDKYFFNIISKACELPITKQYGIYGSEGEFTREDEIIQFFKSNNLDNLVLKPRYGSFGAGIYFINSKNIDKFKFLMKTDDIEYILEDSIQQHSKLNGINPYSVNSIRILTILDLNNKVKILGAMLRTSSNNIPIDNFSLGGIVVGINDDSGTLKKFGIAKNFIIFDSTETKQFMDYRTIKHKLAGKKKKGKIKPGKIMSHHPLTGIEFYNFQIPYWPETLEIVIKGQLIFKHIKSIGWDVAITDNGPIIIEGNTTWGTTGMQAANGGLLTDMNVQVLKQYGIKF